MNFRLSTQLFATKWLNVNNPVRSAGKCKHLKTAALEGLNGFKLIFNPSGFGTKLLKRYNG